MARRRPARGTALPLAVQLSAPRASVSTRGGCAASQAAISASFEQEVAELVGPGQEHLLGERVDLEVDRRAVRQQHAFLGEVDGQLRVGVALDQLPQPAVDLRRHDDRQQPVLEAVAAEDVGEAGREDRADAPRRQRPRRVLARRAGPEVVADEQDLAGRPCPAGRGRTAAP